MVCFIRLSMTNLSTIAYQRGPYDVESAAAVVNGHVTTLAIVFAIGE